MCRAAGDVHARVSRRALLKAAGWALAAALSAGCGEQRAAPAQGAVGTPGPVDTAASLPTSEAATVPLSSPSESSATPAPPASQPATVAATAVAPPAAVATPPATIEPSLQVKIGQMLLAGFRGLEASDRLPVVQDIRDHHLGGVILFDFDVPTNTPLRNIQSPAQVKALIAGLQAAASIPLIVAVDQEGGRVQRLKAARGFSGAPSARALGALGDTARTRQAAASTGRMLAELGFTLNFAPVVDLDVNPENPIIGKLERSFSADPAVVTAQALAFIAGHHDHGVLCTLKHFPGHGSSTADSHRGFVDVTNTWSAKELEPYAALIKAGAADSVMTAHVFNARLDPQFPATLSRATITGLLRDKLGYDGVVFCDDIQMGAIREHYGLETALAAAIGAGVDIITIGNNTIFEEGIVGQAATVIQQLVRDGKLSEARIDQSFGRIQALKMRMNGGKSATD